MRTGAPGKNPAQMVHTSNKKTGTTRKKQELDIIKTSSMRTRA